MIDYQNLRSSYIAAIQFGLTMNAGYEDAKRGNGLLHEFCKKCVDNSNYSESDKQKMKNDLELVKQSLAIEIELRFHGG